MAGNKKAICNNNPEHSTGWCPVSGYYCFECKVGEDFNLTVEEEKEENNLIEGEK